MRSLIDQSDFYRCCEKSRQLLVKERRNYLMLSDIPERLDPDSIWSKLNSVGMVESVRKIDGKTTVETRYFISSRVA